MKIEETVLRNLIPSEGKWLTQSVLVEGDIRVFSDSVFLGKEANVSDWIEWSNDDKLQWEQEHPVEEPRISEN